MSNYGNTLDANPFNDPNPFQHGNESAYSLDGVSGSSSRQPTGGVENIQAYVADHDRRAQELEAKQRELERREADLTQREADVAQYKPNWPPFVPILVHDIKLVPQEQQKNARLMYYYWLALLLTLIINFVGCFPLGVSSIGAGAGYLLFISILSFILWYYPIYTGWRRLHKRGAAILFYTYFIFGGFHLLFALYMCIGAPYTGSAGLFNTITSLIVGHLFAGIVGIFASVGWIVQLLGGIVLYKLVWNYKNHSTEINWASAKSEFTGLKTIFKLFRASS
ncbi:hypothetical protein CspHIS471_0502700 [Cutaneotrichosporon sp. HIS471]|nr:hypothetical protein CspHIS471_0502700 [Cutaneotrichosporon sp. HIS471]